MNKEILPKEVTLEAIQSIVIGSIKGLATREELKMEIGGLQQQIMGIKSDIVISNKHIDGLTSSIDDLPTRSELKNMDQRLEGQIDGLAIGVKNEFDRVYVRLDEMDTHMVTLEEESERRFTAIQNQLDMIHGQYPNRVEHTFLEKRVKRLEKVVFI